jgi:hypothetical protein
MWRNSDHRLAGLLGVRADDEGHVVVLASGEDRLRSVGEHVAVDVRLVVADAGAGDVGALGHHLLDGSRVERATVATLHRIPAGTNRVRALVVHRRNKLAQLFLQSADNDDKRLWTP